MQLYAVFVRGQAEPVAYFSDADQAQRWRRAAHGDAAAVVAVEASVSKSALDDATEAAAAALPAVETPPAIDPDAVRRGEIRARLEAEERDKRLEAEARDEMAAAERERRSAADDRPATPATAEPAVPRRAARE